MSFIARGIRAVEQAPVPDAVTRAGIEFLCARTARRLAAASAADEARFAEDMSSHPVAEHADAANAQHYELPPEFFELTLGPRRKYSSCFYPTGNETLEQAEIAALEATVARAGLADGQAILELGCGWGSLTLYMAERFPAARITAVSNSAPQRRHIELEALQRGLANVRIVTADMNDFDIAERFDRIVSVEMFEHMANWRTLLERARRWISDDGRMFVHIFTHRMGCYRFDHDDPADWIGQHFFTGGIMPSHGLMRWFGDLFEVEEDWRWSGTHYKRTADQWLANFDANSDRIEPILKDVYGSNAGLWRRRWRLFYLATSGLFGHKDGSEWGVSHYLLRPSGT